MTVLSKEDMEKKYEVKALYVDEMEEWINKRNAEKVYINKGVNSDSGLENIVPEEKYWKGKNEDLDSLYEWVAESRVTKTEQEMDVMR